jgi:hypothetical protein
VRLGQRLGGEKTEWARPKGGGERAFGQGVGRALGRQAKNRGREEFFFSFFSKSILNFDFESLSLEF